MQLIALLGNSQRLDGGAMFGNCPRAVWQKWAAPDDLNRIELACRCLLVREAGKNVLLETGIGAFFEPKLKERYGVVENEHVLLRSLSAAGLSDADIDVVVLSHLHFDHAGGLCSEFRDGEPLQLLFPNAKYVVGKVAWERAVQPHARDRASFIPELVELLKRSGRLELVENTAASLDPALYSFAFSDGHTPGLMLTTVQAEGGAVTFASDLIPGAAWVHVPITMGYDRFPELLVEEKRRVLESVAVHNDRIFFTHDPRYAFARVRPRPLGSFEAVDLQSGINAAEVGAPT